MNAGSKILLKQFTLRFSLALAAYALGLVAYNFLFDKMGAFRWLLFLLPVLPTVYMATAIVKSVKGLDELARKMAIEAMAFSGVATGFTCFSFLFLGDLSGKPVPVEWGFYLMWMYYGLGSFLASRRYY